MGELSEGLHKAGFDDVRIDLTHAVADAMLAAAITGRKAPAF